MRRAYNLPAYLPDQAPQASGLVMAENVYPAVGEAEGATRYRPARGFQSVSEALPDSFRGGASFISTGGVAYLLAGTATTLEKLTSGAWTNLLTGLTVTGRWAFEQFGDYVIAVNGGATQEVDLNAGTASALASAPTFTDVTVVGDHVVGAQPDGDILKVAWSAFNDHTGWTPGVDQSGEQPMLTGGEVMGLAGGEYGVILQRQRLVRMSRTGDADAPFQFDEITPNFGCASKASIAQAGRTVFFLSDRGFMALDDGQSIRPIGNEKFDATFRATVSPDDYERLWSAVDPTRSLVMWGVPGPTGRIWFYNWVLDRAGTLSLSFDGFFPGFEDSITLEALDPLYPDMDTMPYSLDDPRWSGGNPRLYFVASGEVGTLTGDKLIATIKTGQLAPSDTKRTRLRAVWPNTDATSGVTFTVEGSQRRGDNPSSIAANAMQASGRVPLRVNERYMSFTIRIDDQDWEFIDGFELEASAGGDR